MQEVDLKLAFFLIPLAYVIIPFFLSGTFLILGGVTLTAFIIGLIIFIIITNLNIGGSAQAVASGGSFNLSLNGEGSHSLFIVFVGGLFYLGANLAQFLAPLLDLIVGIINAIIGGISWLIGADTSGLQTTLVSGLGGSASTNLGSVYPLNISILGISVFGALDVLFASMFILALYFMIATK
jgi:hypothetical protein